MDERRDVIRDLLVYAVALTRRGNHRLGGYFACTAFELVTANRSRKEYWIHEDSSLFADIRNNLNRSLRDTDESLGQILDDCREHRNDIIHNFPLQEWRIDKLIRGLCHVMGHDSHSLAASLEYEDYRRLDIRFGAPLARYPQEPFQGITDEEFSNLFRMRRALSALTGQMGPFLRSLDGGLTFDLLSEVNPTSAYVWAAAVRGREAGRARVDEPSLSVLATNQDVRVYLDFGGRARAGRLAYCDYIASGGLLDFLRKAPKSLEVFDVYWYFNLYNRMPSHSFVAAVEAGPRTLAREMEGWRAVVQDATTLTGNRMLIGEVFEASEVVAQGPSFRAEVERVMRTIYPVFEHITRPR